MAKKRKIVSFLIVVINGYFVCAFILLGVVAWKYYFLNLHDIEPQNDVPTVPFSWEEGHSITPYNTYFPRINSFGSRNLFEISEINSEIVVLLGDSFFFGYGLSDRETVSYFLNQTDKKRRYVNMSFNGFNIWDSVARYFDKYEELPQPPEWIIFQILFHNDIYSSNVVGKIHSYYQCILPPFNYFISKSTFLRSFMGRFEEKVFDDLSPKRFAKYIAGPLDKLKAKLSGSRTRVMVLLYNDEDLFKEYTGKLEEYCLHNDMSFLQVSKLMTASQYEDRRLPDGHPSAELNRLLAQRLKDRIDGLSVRSEVNEK